MKLILHIGTHKTGTTSIQRAFAASRTKLLEKGVWYPQYSDVLGGSKTSYAHLDIAKALMNEKAQLTKEEAVRFLRELSSSAEARAGVHTVVISGETMLRGKVGGEKKKWANIQNFQRQVKENLSGFAEIEVVVTFRNYIDYLESLYNEHVKATTYSKPIESFYNDYRERFNYKAIVSTWEKNVGAVKVVNFSEIAGQHIAENWSRIILGENFTGCFSKTDPESNVSWPLALVDIKRTINALNDKAYSHSMRQKISEFGDTEFSIKTFSQKQAWLSQDYYQQLVDSYQQDIDWLTENYSPSCATLGHLPNSDKAQYQGLKDEYMARFIRFAIGTVI